MKENYIPHLLTIVEFWGLTIKKLIPNTGSASAEVILRQQNNQEPLVADCQFLFSFQSASMPILFWFSLILIVWDSKKAHTYFIFTIFAF